MSSHRKALTARLNIGVPAACPSVISNARPSSSRSDARGGCDAGGAPLAARAVSSTPGAARQTAGEQHGGERFQIGLTREPRIERLEPLGGLEQQRRSVATAAQRERDLTTQQVDLGALELVQRSGLCDRDKSERRVERAGLVLGLGRGERSPRPARRLGRQHGGTLQERGRCRQPSARLSAARRALELGRDVLVEARRRLGEMPGAAIGIDLGIGRVRQRTMHRLPVLRRGRPIDGRADQRVTKGHARADREQPVGLGRRPDPDPEPLGRPPQQHRVADRHPPPRPATAAGSPPGAPRACGGSCPRSALTAPARPANRTRPPAQPASTPAAAPTTPAGCRASPR